MNNKNEDDNANMVLTMNNNAHDAWRWRFQVLDQLPTLSNSQSPLVPRTLLGKDSVKRKPYLTGA